MGGPVVDPVVPTPNQNAALAGSYGTPGAANRYVTETDPNYLASNKYRQSVFSEISANTTTNSTGFVDFLTSSITTTAGGILLVHFDCSFWVNAGSNRFGVFQVVIDSTAYRSTSGQSKDSDQFICVALSYRKVVAAGAHTVKIQWKTGAGNIYCYPVSNPEHHASLLIEEVGV